MQWLIAGLINLVLQFLEASFRQQQQHNNPNSSFGKADYGDDDGHNNNPLRNNNKKKQQQLLLQNAYEFMELIPPVSEEQLRKQYKKLSLRYHPDRNGGSEDSKVKFQKLRDCRDWIEKELSGLLNNDDDDNNNNNNNEEPQQRQQDDDHDDDDFYNFIQKQQAAQRKYKEMQQAAEKVRQEEFQRQEELKQVFHSQMDDERQRCQMKQHEMKLETKVGRIVSYEKFQQLAQETIQRVRGLGLDSNSSSSSSSSRTINKPKYDIMEYNTNDIIMALRWNMPDIVFDLMNQQLPTFAETKGQELIQKGIVPVTAQRLKMEYIIQGFDDDQNNLLHYAIYYECYQIITMICTTALQDGYLDLILNHQCNIHTITPLFFAKVAQDTSIVSLLQNYLLVNDEEKANTQIKFAVQTGIKRLWTLIRYHFGFVTTLDTILSFWMAYTLFGMYPISCIVSLYWTNIIHTKSIYLEEIPGIHSFSTHIAFCTFWVLITRWMFVDRFFFNNSVGVILFIFLLALLLLARSCAAFLDLDTSLLDRIILLPIWLSAKVGDELERILILSQQYIIPNMVLQKSLARSYLLIITAVVLPWIMGQVISFLSR